MPTTPGGDFSRVEGMQTTPSESSASLESAVAAQAINAVKIYGKGDTAVHALDGVDVSFDRGHFTAIMGPSGSGKSTLMHCLAGLDTLTSGQILIGDTDLGTLDDKSLTQLRRDRVGFIFQSFNLVPTLTAAGEHRPARRPRRPQARQDLGRSHHRRPSDCNDRLKHRPNELSGGQQQRVAAARALASASRRSSSPTNRPATWTHGPAPRCCHFLRQSVREFGQTIVMVTHDPTGAALRRPGRVPRRRPHRRRDARTDRREGARPHEEHGVAEPCGKRPCPASGPTSFAWS